MKENVLVGANAKKEKASAPKYDNEKAEKICHYEYFMSFCRFECERLTRE